ncbi:hypothetical protein CYY_005730 [Polysphondylium violaceum]|uniref:Pre-mRNA-splicing factor 38 n=1 Tax=Polysphondylium violaceum TaxID=133409 RepID=A0A8J4PUM0_9MYCE|nr:hypothetical protein CYY_005730 [Polysphondylium violaceum]
MALELHGNEKTMNLENVLLTTIQSSQYFKNLYSKKTYHEVIDEIYNNVEFLTPYIPNTKTPSTAFCLLYKFFLMKLTEKQMVGLLEHPDSPYIRAIGFLYLRYCTPPAQLWDWFIEFLDDQETIKITPRGPDVKMQKFILDLLRETKFSDTILPRIPVKIQKEIDKQISDYEIENGLNRKDNGKYNSSNNNNNNNNRRSNERDNRDRYDDRDGRDSRDRNYRDNRDRYDNRDNRDRNYNSRDRNDDRDSRDRYDGRDNRDRYDNDRNGRSNDRYNNKNDRYNSRSDDRDRYERDDRYRDHRFNKRDNDRYDDQDNREKSYEDQLKEFSNKKRSRSRSPSRERYNNNSSPSSSTTTTTTTTTSSDSSKPKEESENLKRLRSLYGADTDKVSLEDNNTSSSSRINDTDTITIGK